MRGPILWASKCAVYMRNDRRQTKMRNQESQMQLQHLRPSSSFHKSSSAPFIDRKIFDKINSKHVGSPCAHPKSAINLWKDDKSSK